MAEQYLNGAQVSAGLQQMSGEAVTKGMGMQRFLILARSAASRQACQTTLSSMGLSAVCHLPPGNSQVSGLRRRLR